MKKLLMLLLLLPLLSTAQDQSEIVVNIRDNARLQFNGAAVKQKAAVVSYTPVSGGGKDFTIVLRIKMYESNGGNYGSLITELIQADATLSEEEKQDLVIRYADKIIEYSTAGRYVDASGNLVSPLAGGAIPELQYWQAYKLNQVPTMLSLATQGALDATYKTIQAIIAKMNARKNF